jgi:hypothetical protein
MTSVPEQKSGVASAINNAISRVGPQLAGALIFVAIAGTFYTNLAGRVPGLDPANEQVRQEIAPLNRPKANAQIPVAGGVVSGAEIAKPVAEASTDSFALAMEIGAGLLLAGALVNAFGIKNPPRARLAAATGDGSTPAEPETVGADAGEREPAGAPRAPPTEAEAGATAADP